MASFNNGFDMATAALAIMHYQTDVFDILFEDLKQTLLIDRCNRLLRCWRAAGRPIIFANFMLGPNYERAPPATNLQISPYVDSGRFCSCDPVEGLDVVAQDSIYQCSRASIFHGTSIESDLRSCNVDTIYMVGISTTGVVLSSVASAADADFRLVVVDDCCYDPDVDAHNVLTRSSFGGRATMLRSDILLAID